MRKLLRQLFSFVSLCLLLVAVISPASVGAAARSQGAERTATLSELLKLVETRADSTLAFTDAVDGEVLSIGGQAHTGAGARARLDLSDGTIFRLDDHSLFTLEALESSEGGLTTRLRLVLGRVWIILSGGSMQVETPNALAAVRGSLLSVHYIPETGITIVTCLEGHCTVFANGVELVLPQGMQAIIVGADSIPVITGPISEEELTAWLENNPEAAIYITLPIGQPPNNIDDNQANDPPAGGNPDENGDDCVAGQGDCSPPDNDNGDSDACANGAVECDDSDETSGDDNPDGNPDNGENNDCPDGNCDPPADDISDDNPDNGENNDCPGGNCDPPGDDNPGNNPDNGENDDCPGGNCDPPTDNNPADDPDNGENDDCPDGNCDLPGDDNPGNDADNGENSDDNNDDDNSDDQDDDEDNDDGDDDDDEDDDEDDDDGDEDD